MQINDLEERSELTEKTIKNLEEIQLRRKNSTFTWEPCCIKFDFKAREITLCGNTGNMTLSFNLDLIKDALEFENSLNEKEDLDRKDLHLIQTIRSEFNEESLILDSLKNKMDDLAVEIAKWQETMLLGAEEEQEKDGK